MTEPAGQMDYTPTVEEMAIDLVEVRNGIDSCKDRVQEIEWSIWYEKDKSIAVHNERRRALDKLRHLRKRKTKLERALAARGVYPWQS